MPGDVEVLAQPERDGAAHHCPASGQYASECPLGTRQRAEEELCGVSTVQLYFHGGGRGSPPMGSNPLVQTFSVAHSHNPPWLLLALWLAAAPPTQQAWFPQRGGRRTALFSPRLLTQPFCYPNAGRPGKDWPPPGHGEATQLLLEQRLAKVGCRWEAARFGLAEEHLPSVVWGPLVPPGIPAGPPQAGLSVAA